MFLPYPDSNQNPNTEDNQNQSSDKVDPRLRALQYARAYAGALSSNNSSGNSVGDQLESQVTNESGWEDIAGLKPLPIDRMHRQAGRPMYRDVVPFDERNNIIFGETPKMRREKARETFPERSRQTLERNARNRNTILNWDPLEAELKQKFNNINPNPRSRMAAQTRTGFDQALDPLVRGWQSTLYKAQLNLPPPDINGPVPFEKGERDRDVSALVSDKMQTEIKNQLFRYLDALSSKQNKKQLQKYDLPYTMQNPLKKLGNDWLYEWNNRDKAALRERTVDMLGASRDVVRPVEPFEFPRPHRALQVN